MEAELTNYLGLIGVASFAQEGIDEQIVDEGAEPTLEAMICILENFDEAREHDVAMVEGIVVIITSALSRIICGVATSQEYLQELRQPQVMLEVLPGNGVHLVQPADRQIILALVEPACNDRFLSAVFAACDRAAPQKCFCSHLLSLIFHIVSAAGVSIDFIDEIDERINRLGYRLMDNTIAYPIVCDLMEMIERERTDPAVDRLNIL